LSILRTFQGTNLGYCGHWGEGLPLIPDQAHRPAKIQPSSWFASTFLHKALNFSRVMSLFASLVRQAQMQNSLEFPAIMWSTVESKAKRFLYSIRSALGLSFSYCLVGASVGPPLFRHHSPSKQLLLRGFNSCIIPERRWSLGLDLFEQGHLPCDSANARIPLVRLDLSGNRVGSIFRP
jgi:hypothetical protein